MVLPSLPSIKVSDEGFILLDDIFEFLILLPQILCIFLNYLGLVLQNLDGFLSHAFVATQVRTQLLFVKVRDLVLDL